MKKLKHKIISDLQSAHQFEEEEEIFFQGHFKEAIKLIRDRVDNLDSPSKSDLEDPSKPLPETEQKLLHRHTTIGIFGQRGAGKTSFLLTIREAFNSEGGGDLIAGVDDIGTEKSRSLRKDVSALGTIDPSLIENEDKLLVTITSKIIDQVRNYNDGDLQGKTAIQDALEDLSRRFRVLFPEASDKALKETASDPLRFASEVLFDADSGPKLATSFHRFVALAAEDIGVKCFLLPIDDVDTSFDKGWPMLETLRKYLATDRLLTVVSGDLEFFDLIVQQEAHERTKGYRDAETKYLNLRSDDLHDGEKLSNAVNLRRKTEAVRRFPDQYLLKVFPDRSRVRLPNIHSVILDSESKVDLGIEFKSEANKTRVVSLGPAVLTVSRLLFGTAYSPPEDEEQTSEGDREIPIFSDPKGENTRGKEGKKGRSGLDLHTLSNVVGPNAIDSLLPTNTRRFVSFLEDLPGSLGRVLNGDDLKEVSTDIRKRIAENHSGLLRMSGLDVEELDLIARGRGQVNLSRAFMGAQVGAIDLARLQPDLFRDHTSYDQWRALLSLVSSSLYADWSSTLTGLIRYAIKVWDTLHVAESTPGGLSGLDTGLNEPVWKSRCRLMKAELSKEWEFLSGNKRTVDITGTSIRIPRKQVSKYDSFFVNIAPSSTNPDFLRWWKKSWERGKETSGIPFKAKNRALISDITYHNNTESHARAVHGVFRTAFRKGNVNYRYVDFGRGLARIEDFYRDSTTSSASKHGEHLRVTKLIHEATDFVLQLDGGSDQSSDASEDKDRNQAATRLEKSETETERLEAYEEAVNSWCTLGKKISTLLTENIKAGQRDGSVMFSDEKSVVPYPWILIKAYERYRTNTDELASLPWRQQTVGTMLERHTMAFWNALLQEEIQFRIDQQLVSRSLSGIIDSGLVRDNRNWIAKLQSQGEDDTQIMWESDVKQPDNAFTRNIDALISFWGDDDADKQSRSLIELAPYTLFWLSCPFLLPLVSKGLHSKVIGNLNKTKSDSLLQTGFNFINSKPDDQKSDLEIAFKDYLHFYFNPENADTERPDWQRSVFTFDDGEVYDFDIHDILCGIVRADSAPGSQSEDDKKYLKELGLA